MLGHIDVEARAEDAEMALDDERDRDGRQGDQRHRRAAAEALTEARQPQRCEGARGDRGHQQHDQRGQAVAGQADRPPGEDARRPEADDRRGR